MISDDGSSILHAVTLHLFFLQNVANENWRFCKPVKRLSTVSVNYAVQIKQCIDGKRQSFGIHQVHSLMDSQGITPLAWAWVQ